MASFTHFLRALNPSSESKPFSMRAAIASLHDLVEKPVSLA